MKNSGCMATVFLSILALVIYGWRNEDFGAIFAGCFSMFVFLVIWDTLRRAMPSIDDIETTCPYCDLKLIEGSTYRHKGRAICSVCGTQHNVNVHVIYQGILDGRHEFRATIPKTCSCGDELHTFSLLCGHSRSAKIVTMYRAVHHWKGDDGQISTFTDPWSD